MKRLWIWVLRKFFGYVRISDYIDITVNTTPYVGPVPKFNKDLIIGKERYNVRAVEEKDDKG
jgi:hypothetical protein